MKKALFLLVLALCSFGLQAQNYHINIHNEGNVLYDHDVNTIDEIMFQGSNPARMVVDDENGTHFFSVAKFDSITFYLEPIIPPAYGDDFMTICDNELPYTWQGVTFTEAGTQVITLQTPQGCDSIVTLHLTVNPTKTSDDYLTICQNALPYTWQGVTFTGSGTKTITLQTSQGCDSIVKLHLTVSPTLTGDDYMTICQNELPYTWQGLTFTSSGTKAITLQSAQGCDSVVTLHLTVVPALTSDDYMTICDNELPYTWQGQTFTSGGTKTITLQSAQGCDSIVTLHLTVNPTKTGDDYMEVCENELPYTWQGQTFTASGTKTITLQSAQGCDSIVTLHLTVNPTKTGDDYLTINSDELPYTWQGVTFNEAGTQTVTLESAQGCDSIVSLHLTVNAVPLGDTVFITYAGNAVSVINPFSNAGVSVSNSSADVTVNSTKAAVPYVISGSSSNGSLVINSSNALVMILNNLSLSNSSTAAINVTTAVDVALLLKGISNLADGANSALNGAFLTAGNVTMSGSGNRLKITGNAKHGFVTSGTFTLNSGHLDILDADSDGIHCNAVTINNGNVTVENCGSDGIESTNAMSILNGQINLSSTAVSAKGINAKSTLQMSNGNLTVVTSGSTSKGIKVDGQMTVSGGTLNVNAGGEGSNALSSDTEIRVQGGHITLDMTATDCKGINSNGNITVTGGNIDITSTGASSKGMKADGNLSISGGTHTLNISGSGANGISSDTNVAISNNADITVTTSSEDGKAIKSDGTMNISGGAIHITHSGNMSKGLKSDGTLTISGGTIGITASGSTVLETVDGQNEPSYCSAIKGDGHINISGGDFTITLPSTNQGGKGISADSTLIISGGTFNINTQGNGAIYTVSGSTQDTYASACLRSNGNMSILAGNLTLTSSGTGGKGIKVGTKTASGSGWGGTTYTYSGTYTQGSSNGTGPTLNITTTGAELGSSGGGGGPGGGWPPGGGGSSSSAHASAKAIKVGGLATLYGGTTTVTTTKNKAEGLESKTQIKVEGGQHYFKCYDDCINSAGTITFNGGVTVCFSNGNDAIDSNAGTAGAITIGNGVAFAYTTKGSPEEGFDCDNNSYIRITGTGIGISAGGSQGGGGGGWPGGGGSGNTISGAVQGYYFHTSSYSFQTGRYYTLSNTNGAGGSNLVTFSFEANCSSNLTLITATGMQHGSTYYVKYGTQAPTNPTTAFHGLYIGGTSSASTQAFSFTAQ